MEIVGFDHDDLTNGGKAVYTFGMKNLMSKNAQMNGSSLNYGSFIDSAMCAWLNGEMYNSMDADLKSAVKTVYKLTGKGNGSTSGTQKNSMKIFLFSEQEVYGKKIQSVGNEGMQYNRFTSDSVRSKKLSNGSGAAGRWWLRSPSSGSGTSFVAVNENGADEVARANSLYGVCFGFCV